MNNIHIKQPFKAFGKMRACGLQVWQWQKYILTRNIMVRCGVSSNLVSYNTID